MLRVLNVKPNGQEERGRHWTAYVEEVKLVLSTYYFPRIQDPAYQQLLRVVIALQMPSSWQNLLQAECFAAWINYWTLRLVREYGFQQLEFNLRRDSSPLRLLVKNRIVGLSVQHDAAYLQQLNVGYARNFELLSTALIPFEEPCPVETPPAKTQPKEQWQTVVRKRGKVQPKAVLRRPKPAVLVDGNESESSESTVGQPPELESSECTAEDRPEVLVEESSESPTVLEESESIESTVVDEQLLAEEESESSESTVVDEQLAVALAAEFDPIPILRLKKPNKKKKKKKQKGSPKPTQLLKQVALHCRGADLAILLRPRNPEQHAFLSNVYAPRLERMLNDSEQLSKLFDSSLKLASPMPHGKRGPKLFEMLRARKLLLDKRLNDQLEDLLTNEMFYLVIAHHKPNHSPAQLMEQFQRELASLPPPCGELEGKIYVGIRAGIRLRKSALIPNNASEVPWFNVLTNPYSQTKAARLACATEAQQLKEIIEANPALILGKIEYQSSSENQVIYANICYSARVFFE